MIPIAAGQNLLHCGQRDEDGIVGVVRQKRRRFCDECHSDFYGEVSSFVKKIQCFEPRKKI